LPKTANPANMRPIILAFDFGDSYKAMRLP
jgi:hypothetical protein